MTLNTKIGFFCGFFGDLGLQVTFQEQIEPKSIDIDMDKLHTKFSILNVDFDSTRLHFFRFKATYA